MKKLIVGNWKMNPRTSREAKTHFLAIKKEAASCKNADVALCVPAVYLSELSKYSGKTLALGAQNVSAEKEGPYTGEISAAMLSQYKVRYCIVGHSERRALGETNEFINRKIKSLLAARITPILCVGEKDREHGMWYLSVVKTQVEECLVGIPKNLASKIVIAYEPVWALTSTKNRRDTTPEECSEMLIYIRKILADKFGHTAVKSTKVLYGGSADEKSALGFLSTGTAAGLLPGKASINPKKFGMMLKITNSIK